MDLLFDFAVLKSNEVDEPASKLDQLVELATAAGEKLSEIGAYLRRKLEALGALQKKPADSVPQIVVLYEAPVVRKMIADVKTLQTTIAEQQASGQAARDPVGFEALVVETQRMSEELGRLQITLNKVVIDTIDMADAAERVAKTGGTYRGLTGVNSSR